VSTAVVISSLCLPSTPVLKTCQVTIVGGDDHHHIDVPPLELRLALGLPVPAHIFGYRAPRPPIMLTGGWFAATSARRSVRREHQGPGVVGTAASWTTVIAAVNGLALGGGFELVLSSAFPILSTQAFLGLPESGLGLIPGYGGTQRLARVVGSAVAAHVMLTGSRLSADRAYQLGLTPLAPVAAEQLLDVACEVADAIAARGPRATRAIVQALGDGADMPIDGARPRGPRAILHGCLKTNTATKSHRLVTHHAHKPAAYNRAPGMLDGTPPMWAGVGVPDSG